MIALVDFRSTKNTTALKFVKYFKSIGNRGKILTKRNFVYRAALFYCIYYLFALEIAVNSHATRIQHANVLDRQKILNFSFSLHCVAALDERFSLYNVHNLVQVPYYGPLVFVNRTAVRISFKKSL